MTRRLNCTATLSKVYAVLVPSQFSSVEEEVWDSLESLLFLPSLFAQSLQTVSQSVAAGARLPE